MGMHLNFLVFFVLSAVRVFAIPNSWFWSSSFNELVCDSVIIYNLPSQPRLTCAVGGRLVATTSSDFATADEDLKASIDVALLRERLRRAENIISALTRGIAVLNPSFQILWVNEPFREWCPNDPIGRHFPEALGKFNLLWPDTLPTTFSSSERSISAQLVHNDGVYLDLRITPVREGDAIKELVVSCVDVTASVVRQQKLDALHRAGQELAALDAELLSEMSVCNRAELLKLNLRRHIHDLLQYNVIEIRILNPRTKKLEPLLEEGMTPDAAARDLYALPTGNGVTGLVGAIGKSYLCTDTKNDPHYIEGSAGAKSSMTVPLIFQDMVIGTFNVESPRLNAFGPEDLQFAELFSREIANALHTLNLLSAQQSCTASQAIEAVNREIALPADELLTLASLLKEQFGDQSTVVDALNRILTDARVIKQNIQNVGEGLAAPGANGTMKKLKGMRILVIDSDERIRRSAHSLLEKQGCQVETAATAKEGLSLAASGNYAGVLVAVRHPDMGGTAVYRQLQCLQPQGRIILTQGFEYDGGHTVVNARQDGYWLPVLFKQPFQEAQVISALTCLPPTEIRTPSVVQAS